MSAKADPLAKATSAAPMHEIRNRRDVDARPLPFTLSCELSDTSCTISCLLRRKRPPLTAKTMGITNMPDEEAVVEMADLVMVRF
jgi:hypothetical protein